MHPGSLWRNSADTVHGDDGGTVVRPSGRVPWPKRASAAASTVNARRQACSGPSYPTEGGACSFSRHLWPGCGFSRGLDEARCRRDEHFDGPWLGNASPDGLFRKDGDWVGTGGNLLQAANASILPDPAHRGGVLRLMVPGGQAAPPFRAAEIASTPGIEAGGGGRGYG